MAQQTSKGIVYLVGAGPGDIGLLTLRGAELLGRAEVVVYDRLVNPALLRLASASAEIILGGKQSEDQPRSQAELSALLVAKAKAGKIVVRLKGGDPYIFGRGGEEAEELAAAKIPFEVVPGVSSISAVSNYAGIPLTHRDHNSAFTVLTGHEDPAKDESTIDWAQVAAAPGTKVVLMGLKRIRSVAQELVRHGMAADTPVAMIRAGTTGSQQTISGTLATIADLAEKSGMRAPTLTVIGSVVNLRSTLNWFERRPLFGQRVVVTRAREQVNFFSHRLSELGAEVLEIPTIKIAPPDDLSDFKDALLSLHEYDWVVFTSANGVTTFFDYFFKGFDDLRDVGGVRFAAVGPGTAAKLAELHLKVELMPEESTAARIAEAFQKYQSIENLRILIMRAQVANRELPAALERLGGIVDDVACYKTVSDLDDLSGGAADFGAHGADWLTFTSGSTAEQFHLRFNLPQVLAQFPKLRIVSIGPETTKVLTKLGATRVIEAKAHSTDGIIHALVSAAKDPA